MSDARAPHPVPGHVAGAINAALGGFDPTPEQWAAITHPLEPVHLVAGAGSGKTAVMAARIVWIIESQGYGPDQILGLTFTNKAASELQERVSTALAASGLQRLEDVTVHTYHAFSASVVREHGLLGGVEPDAGLLSEAQQWQLVLGCINELPPFDAIELRTPARVVRDALTLSSSIADHMVSTASVVAADERILSSAEAVEDKILETSMKRRELCMIAAAYRDAKTTTRIDFGDQVTKAVEILEGHPEVRSEYRQRWPIVLLDEYQDTNVAQRKLIQALSAPGGAITAVGDTRQAIYAFRGATMYNLIGFPRDFPRAHGGAYGELSLSDNFRSGSRILEVANHVVKGIPDERRPGRSLRALARNDKGYVGLGLFADEAEEAAFVADECVRLHGSTLQDGRRPVDWKDIAVLVRRKSTMGPLIAAFAERKVPLEVTGLTGLLSTPEVLEVVAWLRCLQPRASANRWIARILFGPRWRIHFRDLALCAHWAADQNWELKLKLAAGDSDAARDMEPGDLTFSLSECLDHLDEIEGLGAGARSRLADFAARLDALRNRAQGPLIELVQEVIKTSGVEDAIESSTAPSAPAARQNLSSFLDYVVGFAPVEGEASLRTFIEFLDAAEAAEETLEAAQPTEVDSVKLMTVHSAKGLEFECVFVPSVAAGRRKSKDAYRDSVFPNERTSNPLTSHSELPYEVREDKRYLPRWDGGKLKDFVAAVKERAMEDERRLFYVALTRAKQYLMVGAAWWYGRNQRPKGPSQFFDELRELAAGGPVEVVADVEQPPDNPLLGRLEQERVWPPPARPLDDPLFEGGWGVAADELLRDGSALDPLLTRLSAQERARTAELIREHNADLQRIRAAEARSAPTPELPDVISATNYARLQAGELEAWDLVRPLPQRPTTARRLGTEVHRLIEERTRGMAPYPEEAELDEPGATAQPGVMAELLARFEESPYAGKKLAHLPSGEPMLELPFALKRDGRIIRGRIDAVYETEDGGLEIVDFKTGSRAWLEAGAGEPPVDDQLAVYAAALEANGLLAPSRRVTLTYFFLDGGPPVSRTQEPGGGLVER